MSSAPISIQIDNRIRLLSALLSLTTWPEQEQAYKPHGVHAHARSTRTVLGAGEYHPAVLSMQELLETTRTLSEIFSYAAYLNWPGLRIRGKDAPGWAPAEWPAQIRDFAHAYRVADLWDRDKVAWANAESAARNATAQAGDPLAVLSRFFGPLELDLIFVPNLCYPSSETLAFRDAQRLVCICPPPVAWGTNPPWPYDDNPADPCREAFSAYARLLLGEMLAEHPAEAAAARRTRLPIPNTFRARHPEWFDQFAVLFVSGVTALYLRDTFGKPEADAYMLMVHKANGFDALPSVVSVLENYVEAHAQGKFGAFVEYLPAFTKSLRVTEKLKRM